LIFHDDRAGRSRRGGYWHQLFDLDVTAIYANAPLAALYLAIDSNQDGSI
jgi:hypothetical protein